MTKKLSSKFNWVPSLPKLTHYSFFTAVFFVGSVELIAGIALLIAVLAAAMLIPSSFRFLHGGTFFTKVYIYTCSAFIVIVLLNVLFGRAGAEGYGLPATLILPFIIALAVSKYSTESGTDLIRVIALVSGAHAFFLTAIGFAQVFVFHIPRAHGSINANIFAHILATSGGIFAVYLFQSARNSSNLKPSATLLVWLLLIIFSVHLTGTRGAIIAFIPMLLGLLYICLKDMKKGGHALIIVVLTIALIFLLVLILGSERFELGINQAMRAAEGYQNQGSIGMRVDVWTEAIRLIIERPLTGHGLISFSEINNLPSNFPSKDFSHTHNQYLDVWVKAGIGGLLFLLAFLGLPMFVGWKLLTEGIDPGVGLTLIWLGGSFLVYGLTEMFLGHTNTIVLLATYIPMLLIIADKKIVKANLIIASK